MDSGFRVAVIQHDPVVGDIAGNAERIASEYESTLASNPSMVVAPELALVGYPPRDLLHRDGVLDAQAAALDMLAEQTTDGPPLVVGATVRTDHGTGAPLHNAAVFLRDGRRVATYHKRLLPTYDVFDEHRYYRPGEKPVVVTVDGVEVGLTVCEDAWNDAVVTGQRRHGIDPLAETAAAGADCILTLSASPFSLDKPARREQRFIDHATNTDCPVVFANQVGGNDELVFDGHSFVASEGIHERLAGFDAETAVVDVPLDGQGASVPRYERDPATQARGALALGVSDYFEKTGFEEAVIGLSGGIDSSVAATLAADALGADNVYGVSLPSTITSKQSIADARAVAENLGIGFDVIPVGGVVEALGETVAENAVPLTGVAFENIQARVRGTVLMGLANERDALVLTPDNKSEAAVGYCTLYGDTVGALAPLGDCQKWLVYELAGAFNERPPADARTSPVIPASVIEKAPTAELAEDQTDADDLPPYEQLDPVLEAYIEDGRDGSGLREEYTDEIVEEALTRIAHSEFKRRQTPPPLRITRKALGRGWNYPVAASYDHVLGRGE
jgi:NAD+ synthase/NAD+ synthase (glutamine-hydrolysing)